MSPTPVLIPKGWLEKKPKHGEPCNRCGVCCYAALCDLAVSVFDRPQVPGPCPALVRSVTDGGYACGMIVQPSRFNPEGVERYGEDLVRNSAKLLINAYSGCDMRLSNEEENAAYTAKCDLFDQHNADVRAAAKAIWGMKR